MTPRLLDFVYEKYNDTYNLTEEAYADDKQLLAKIQSGKGDPEIYKGYSLLYLDTFVAGTVPDKIEQDLSTGSNDLSFAAVSISQITLDTPPEGDNDILGALEYEIYLETQKFNEQSKHLQVDLITLRL